VASKALTITAAVAIACGLSASLRAAEGILLVQKMTTGNETTTSQVQIEKTRMRAEVVDQSGKRQVVVFDGAKQVMTIIDMNAKTYSELTKADVDRMRAQIDGAMAQMQAQLAQMPPEQRAQIEAMMRGRGMPGMAAPVKTEYRRIGSGTVGKWACDKYDAYQNGQKTGEICTVNPTALGFGASDFDVTRQMASFFASLVPAMADQIAAIGKTEEQGFSGFPIRHVTSVGDRQTVSEVTEASRQTFADSLFAVPAGFTKRDLMGGRGRGGK
jgi:hypothetical protein